MPPSPVASTQDPPVGTVVVPHAEIALTTGSKPAIPSTVTTCVAAVATNLNQTEFSVPVTQSPVSLLSVAAVVEPVVGVQDVLGVNIVAPLQISFAGGADGVEKLVGPFHELFEVAPQFDRIYTA